MFNHEFFFISLDMPKGLKCNWVQVNLADVSWILYNCKCTGLLMPIVDAEGCSFWEHYVSCCFSSHIKDFIKYIGCTFQVRICIISITFPCVRILQGCRLCLHYLTSGIIETVFTVEIFVLSLGIVELRMLYQDKGQRIVIEIDFVILGRLEIQLTKGIIEFDFSFKQ